tara:strand:+ start:12660 stop:13580 length:921 start_codon:yes stop_codon:yes gene_type:complete
LGIVVAAFYFIYQKLTTHSKLNFYDFIDFLNENHVFSLKHIISLFILTFFNWFFEILKWQKLVSPIKKISFKNAVQQSLGALTASLFTPNKIGEYGAKAAFYVKEFRKRILFVNLLSNLMQMAATCLLGIIGLWFFINEFPLKIDYNKMIVVLTIGVFALLIIGFIIRKYAFKIREFQIEKIIRFTKQFPKNIIFMGFSFSLIRYLIFSFQFYYLLHIFGAEIDYFNAMGVITSMYFLASILPTIFIFDVVIKGSVAVYLFSFLSIHEFTILSIITLMWLLNLVLPSIYGSYYVLRFNFPKNTVNA